MEMTFDVDLNLEEENQSNNDNCNFHDDYDNQKLFSIYESYLAKGDVSDTESEPEISFNDLIETQMKTPLNSRMSRRVSCFADIDKDIDERKSISRESTPEASHLSIDELNDLIIPWNLNEMNEKEIINLINKLEDDLSDKESTYPEMAANNMKANFDKQIDLFENISIEFENKFRQRMEKINEKRYEQKIPYDQHLDQELKEIKYKCEQITKLMFELKLIRELSNK